MKKKGKGEKSNKGLGEENKTGRDRGKEEKRQGMGGEEKGQG